MNRKTKPSREQEERLRRGRIRLASEIAGEFARDHEAKMKDEGRTMPEHRRHDPRCPNCRLIREAKAYIREKCRYDFTPS